MQNLELGSASDVKNDAASMIPPHRRRRYKLVSVWTLLFILVISALVYVSVALHRNNQNDPVKANSNTQPQTTNAAAADSGAGSGPVSAPTPTQPPQSIRDGGGEETESESTGAPTPTPTHKPTAPPTTHRPTASPTTPNPTASPTKIICDFPYDCQTDRMGHETPLYAGQGLCNKQYRFGVTTEGIFQWYDCATNTSKVIYDATCQENNGKALPHYFSMSPNATLRLFDDQDQIIWQKESKLSISFSPRCLSSPALDCPYFHLHAEGTLVLNSVSDAGWSNRKIEKAFDDLYLNYTILNC